MNGTPTMGTERERREAIDAVAALLTPQIARHMAALMSVEWTEDEAREIVGEAMDQCQGNI